MSDAGVPDLENKWWYNSRTGEVEHGLKTASRDRIGPFDTREGAEHALDKLRENSAKWAEEDAND
jgi:hypothetical protein